MFAQHDDVAYNYGSNMFGTEEMHKIAILDIRILNADRNDENMLVKKRNSRLELIPIDHGLSLPDTIDICRDNVIWMDWA